MALSRTFLIPSPVAVPRTPNLAARPDSIDKLVSNLQVTDEERRKLVNTRIDPALMGTVLDFLYKDKHADSVPPMLQLTPVNPLQPVGVPPVGWPADILQLDTDLRKMKAVGEGWGRLGHAWQRA